MKNPWKLAAIALAVVVVVGLLAGAFLLGRNGQKADPPPPTTPGTTGVSTPAPTAASTSVPVDPSATTGDALARGPVVAGKGGIPAGPGGLHVKYPRTADGAVAAATNYYTAVWSTRVFHDAAYRTALAKAITGNSATETAVLDQLDAYGKGAVPSATIRVAPERGAYAVESNDQDQMKVLLWLPMCNGTATECSWTLVAIVLVWEKEDWKLFSPGIASGAQTLEPSNKNGIPSPEEKYRLLKLPLKDPDPASPFAEAYKLPWREYDNAAR